MTKRLIFPILLLLPVLLLLLVGRGPAGAWAPMDVQLHNDNGEARSYGAFFAQSYVVGAVLRATDDDYPIQIRSVQARLYRFPGAVDSVQVRVVIYSIGADGSPQTLLGASDPVQVTTFHPDEVSIPLPEPISLQAPQSFLAGIEYMSGVEGSTPSILFDSSTNIPRGKNYFSPDGGGAWYEHYDFWQSPAEVGFAMIRATVSTRVGTPVTLTPTPTPTATSTPSPFNLWPGFPIGYGKQHGMARDHLGRLHMVYFGPEHRALYHAWTDDGVHWQPPLAQRVPFYTFERPGGGGSLALDADGETLHLVIGQDPSTTYPDGGINGALYFEYRDGRWRGGDKISSNGYGYHLAVDSQGGVHVVWSFRDIWYRYRTPEGVWEPAHIIAYGGWYPDIDIGPDGVMHVVYNSNDFCCSATWVEVYYIQSTDGGRTWSVAERLTHDDRWTGDASGAVDGHGVYHLTYIRSAKVEGDLYYTARYPDGHWTSPQLLMRGVMTGQTGAESAALEADDAGNLAALFYCSLAGDSRTVCLDARDGQKGWLDVRYLAVLNGLAFSPTMADGPLDIHGVDVTWGVEGQIAYRRITDIVIEPTPTPTPTPTSTPKPFHVRVLDDTGAPMRGALVYRNGVFAGRTREDGVLNFDILAQGDEIVALAPLPLQASRLPGTTHRSQHDRDIVGDDPVEPWAFRVYLTNMRQSPDLGPQPPALLSHGDPGERVITVYRDSPLILFNLVVSIEWDADEAYLDDLQQGLLAASHFLYDVSDGQMALGRVAIFDKAQHWADADIRIAANNHVFPHAAVDGVSANRHDFNVRLGPLWNGQTARLLPDGRGFWSHDPGWQTIVHELGHYLLGLYDEYVHYIEVGGSPREEPDVYCTHRTNDPNAPMSPNRASIMDNEHLASELADDTLPALWSERCKHTEQWDRTGGESDWQTVLRRFSAAGEGMARPCRLGEAPEVAYCVWRPGSRGQVIPQPTPHYAVHRSLPLPRIEVLADAAGPPMRRLRIQWQGAAPPPGALSLRVAVEQEIDGKRKYIEEGLVDPYRWETTLFGVAPGAVLHLNAIDRSIQASVPVSDTGEIVLPLTYQSTMALAQTRSRPALSLAPTADGQGLVVTLLHAPENAKRVALWLADAAPQDFPLQRSGDVATVTLPVDFRFRAGGVVQIMDEDGKALGSGLTARFWGRGLAALAATEIFSADGRVRFFVPEGEVGQDTFVVVSALGTAPGKLPGHQVIAGPVYEIRYPDVISPPQTRLIFHPDPSLGWMQTAAQNRMLTSLDGDTWHPIEEAELLQNEQGYAIPWQQGYLALAEPGWRALFLPLVRK